MVASWPLIPGLLFYHKATPRAGRQLLWFSRDGKSLGQVGVEANYGNVDISPKGDRAAVDIVTNGNQDIWVVDLERSVAQPDHVRPRQRVDGLVVAGRQSTGVRIEPSVGGH